MLKLLPKLAVLLNLTAQLVAPVIGLLLLGLFLDKILHTGYLFLIGGVIIGFLASIATTYKIIRRIDKS